MYCENCGHKLNNTDLFCEDCGNKINRLDIEKNKQTDKTLWIVLGCVFGGIFILIVLAILFFGILITNYNSYVEDIIDYDVEEEYYYRDDYDDVFPYLDSF